MSATGRRDVGQEAASASVAAPEAAPETAPETALEVIALSAAAAGRMILDDVSMRVEAGELMGLTGASGSGKTTLLRVVAGLLAPTTGRVLVGGSDVTHLPTHRRGVGMVFQDQALFPHLDVSGNVGYGLPTAGVHRSARRERVEMLLRLVGLDPDRVAAQPVSTLSGGEAQRVAIARALAARPTVLLLDEPLSALDPDAHDRLAADLRTVLRAERITAVHVTHDRAEAAMVCDRVVDLAELSARR